MKKVMVVFGTRPEAIKMCPLVKALQAQDSIETVVCVTAQHREMLDQVLEAFNVVPDIDLNIMKSEQSLFSITSDVLLMMEKTIREVNPDVVLVHGDTTTGFVSALAALYLQVPVGHVEAGLRTYNIYSPFPEEFNRQGIGLIAKYHFAPTETAKKHLLDEGKPCEDIIVTGNTGIDALKTTVIDSFTDEMMEWVGNDRLILITAHRRENIGEPMKNMFNAIKRVLDEHEDIKAIYPIHMNPRVREIADEILKGEERLKLIEPLDVFRFHNYMAKSYLILTDSGGIQEEAPSLGKPVIVMRDTTERPEGVEAGTLVLSGTNEESIYNVFTELLTNRSLYDKMSKAINPYGDGHASERIAEYIAARD